MEDRGRHELYHTVVVSVLVTVSRALVLSSKGVSMALARSIHGPGEAMGVVVILLGELEWVVDVGRYINEICRGFLASSSLEALESGARPMEIVVSAG